MDYRSKKETRRNIRALDENLFRQAQIYSTGHKGTMKEKIIWIKLKLRIFDNQKKILGE